MTSCCLHFADWRTFIHQQHEVIILREYFHGLYYVFVEKLLFV